MKIARIAVGRFVGHLLGAYLYLGAMALITLFVVPIYVRGLGPEVWGVVAWCLTLQGVLFSFDAMFASLMMRDVARAEVAGSIAATYRHHARHYARGAMLLFVAGQVGVFAFAWTSPGALSTDRFWALQLALVQVLFQFSNLAAVGYWIGRHRQHVINLRLTAFALVKHALALVLIARVEASAVAYLLPFALVGAIEFFANRRAIRREIDAGAGSVEASHVPEHRADLAVHAVGALLGIATSQVDRVVLSIALPAADYGRYFLLSSLLLSLLHLQMPLSRIFLPRIATAPDPRRVVLRMMGVAALGLAIPALVLALNAEQVLRWWLADAALAAAGAPSLRLLFLAGALMVISGPMALHWLAEHRYRWLASIHWATLMVQLATMLLLLPRIGMLAGAIAWMAAALVQLGAVLVAFSSHRQIINPPAPRR